jgi:hypothetical protein
VLELLSFNVRISVGMAFSYLINAMMAILFQEMDVVSIVKFNKDLTASI